MPALTQRDLQVHADLKAAWGKYTESLRKKYDAMDKSKPDDAELKFAETRAKEGATFTSYLADATPFS